MARYCVQCHSSQLPSGARNGAPLDHDFDSLAGIRATPRAHLEEVAAAGPEAVNRQMPPPGYPEPTDRERKQLGEWLACGAP
jgi:uncharacterized membrane protein